MLRGCLTPGDGRVSTRDRDPNSKLPVTQQEDPPPVLRERSRADRRARIGVREENHAAKHALICRRSTQRRGWRKERRAEKAQQKEAKARQSFPSGRREKGRVGTILTSFSFPHSSSRPTLSRRAPPQTANRTGARGRKPRRHPEAAARVLPCARLRV